MATSTLTSATPRNVVTCVFLGLVLKQSIPFLLPYGIANLPERFPFTPVDPSNESLMAKSGRLRKLYERVPEGVTTSLVGCETIVFDGDGVMYTMSGHHGQLLRVAMEDDGLVATTQVASLGAGVPLGGSFDDRGRLYVADGVLGLTRIDPKATSKPPTLEILASRVRRKRTGEWSPIRFADDVVVGPKTGKVYFTDASHVPPYRLFNGLWDPTYAAKLIALLGIKTGRVLRYDPVTGDVDEIVEDGIFFANGISIDLDERFLVVADTFASRVLRIDLRDGDDGEPAVAVDTLPGTPDGVSCASDRDGGDDGGILCYAVMPSARPGVLNVLESLPPVVDRWLRTFLTMLPRELSPPVEKYGGVVEFDPIASKIKRLLQDPSGTDISALYGVTVHEKKLYFGSLTNDFIGVYDLT